MVDETAGDPVSGVLWTRRSPRAVAQTLTQKGHPLSAWTVARLLRARRYGLRANRKRLVRAAVPDRDARFRAIGRVRRAFTRRGEPVVSVDGKHHELVGNFKRPGRVWTQSPRDVLMYDYRHDAVGVAIPYGVYDVARDTGYVVLGTSRETSAFAARALRWWWRDVGDAAYPGVRRLLVLCDSGGANAARSGAWKNELQHIADATGLAITVAHYPPGASKWDPIEHRLFNRISANWAGRPLISHLHVLKCLRATRTACGRRCRARLDTRRYEPAGPTPEYILRSLRVRRHRRFPASQYTILPHAWATPK